LRFKRMFRHPHPDLSRRERERFKRSRRSRPRVEIHQRRAEDGDEPAAVFVPAMTTKPAPGQLHQEADPAFTAAVERDDYASIRERVAAVEVDAMRRQMLADDDEGLLGLGSAVFVQRSEMNRI